MLLYHFLSADNALDDLQRKRIRLSLIDDLNDPFELWCSTQENREIRKALRRFKTTMAHGFGVLCFSRNWHNPVLWSHYSDRHRGICLGIEVDENCVRAVEYVAKRTALQLPLTDETARQLLFTKYRGWSYEAEWRSWFRLKERDLSTGHYFQSFGKELRLREVIAGPLCGTPRASIAAAVQSYADQPCVIKARLAFQAFRVVKNQQNFSEFAN